MPKEEIEKLPIVEISQEDVNKNLQCTVCMEDYKLGEPVKQLQCQHVYHSDCIIPWLEMVRFLPFTRTKCKFLASYIFRSSPSTALAQYVESC